MRKAFILVALAMIGCNASTTQDGGNQDSGPSGTTQCAAFATAMCTFISECEPGLLTTTYGSFASCVSVEGSSCVTGFNAPGTALTSNNYLPACGASLLAQATACDAGPVPNEVPSPSDPCALVGAGAAGAPCGIYAQCQSGTCNRTGALCSTCTSSVGAGVACGTNLGASCARGLTCGVNGTCLTIVGVDGGCDSDATTSCVIGTTCVVPDSVTTNGACLASGAALGASCNGMGIGLSRCWNEAGFFCANGHCAAITYANGGVCGTSRDGGVDGGPSDTLCVNAACVNNACEPKGGAGASCGYDQAPGCQTGTICIAGDGGEIPDGSPGTCTAVSPSCALASTGGTTGGTSGGGTTGGTGGGGGSFNCQYPLGQLDSGSFWPPPLGCNNCGLTAECDAYAEQTPTQLASLEQGCSGTPESTTPSACPTANQVGCCITFTFPGYVSSCYYGPSSALTELQMICAGVSGLWDAG